MDNETQEPDHIETSLEPGATATPAWPPHRVVAVGAIIVGLWALTSLGAEEANSSALALLVVLRTLLAAFGRSRLEASTLAGTLMILGAVAAVLSVLDFLAVLTDLDDLADYGGALALVGRFVYLVGGLIMLVGANRTWRAIEARAEPDSGPGASDWLRSAGWWWWARGC